MGKMRIAMMLPGAVSLGAYEGGALAALLVALGQLEGAVVVDSIASASAGSITALLATRCLLRGADPVDLMADAWVTLPSLGNLKTNEPTSPLSMEALRDQSRSLLSAEGAPDGAPVQQEPVRLSMALASLGGLTYRIASVEGHTPVEAVTHLDWFEASFGPAEGPDAYLAAVDGALASAANAIGFLPIGIDRSGVSYQAAGLENPGWVWYTDGGTVDNEPLGRAIDLFSDIAVADDDDRVVVLLDTEPSPVEHGGRWFDADQQPTWLRTALHSYGLQSSHSYYEDLRHLEKVNSRLVWLTNAIATLEQGIADGIAVLPPAEATAMRAALDAAVRAAATQLDVEQNDVRRLAGRPEKHDVAKDLLQLLKRAAGLEGKDVVHVEVVSPRLGPDGSIPAERQLAGEFLGHFGGFLDDQLRQSDFALGYRNMRAWLDLWLVDVVPDAVRTKALAVVDARLAALPWATIKKGDADLGSLSLREDFQLAHLVGHVVHVVEHDLRHWSD